MDLIVKKSNISGIFATPGSKSHTIRGIIAGLIANGNSELHFALLSDDTISVVNAVKKLGAKIEIVDNSIYITGRSGICQNPNDILNMDNSGTGTRLLTAVAALNNFAITFDGDSSLRTRPMKPLLLALQELGASFSATGNSVPFTITGPLKGGKCQVSGVSSQYLSALLFATPLAEQNSTITLESLNEKPYVEMTLDWLKFLGIKVDYSSDLLNYEVAGKQKINSFIKNIPADFSTSLFPLAAGLIANDKEVIIKNLDFNDLQGDKQVFKIFEAMGASIIYENDTIIPAQTKLHGGVFDLNSVPDALPILSAVAATLEGETTILHNVAQARIKETDRITCMRKELTKMGANIEETPDGMIIKGTKLNGAVVNSYNDHRIAMALAIAGLTANSETTIKNVECASVTYPNFIRDFQNANANFIIKGGNNA